ncbi:hypothetical protein CBL_06470 [Carabus blaptoides fortunei]
MRPVGLPQISITDGVPPEVVNLNTILVPVSTRLLGSNRWERRGVGLWCGVKLYRNRTRTVTVASLFPPPEIIYTDDGTLMNFLCTSTGECGTDELVQRLLNNNR